MKILVVAATPSTSSFNFAIAERVVSYLTDQGHEVCFHDLYREKFPPILDNEEIAKDAELDPFYFLYKKNGKLTLDPPGKVKYPTPIKSVLFIRLSSSLKICTSPELYGE